MRKPLGVLLGVVLFAAATAPALAASVAAAAAASPQAKVYDAHMKAMAAGDYKAFRATMSKKALEMMDKQNKDMNLDTGKMMEMKNDCILLEGVVCQACHASRW